jgi:hypothetical protein
MLIKIIINSNVTIKALVIKMFAHLYKLHDATSRPGNHGLVDPVFADGRNGLQI